MCQAAIDRVRLAIDQDVDPAPRAADPVRGIGQQAGCVAVGQRRNPPGRLMKPASRPAGAVVSCSKVATPPEPLVRLLPTCVPCSQTSTPEPEAYVRIGECVCRHDILSSVRQDRLASLLDSCLWPKVQRPDFWDSCGKCDSVRYNGPNRVAISDEMW
jgi:hypothetical protein